MRGLLKYILIMFCLMLAPAVKVLSQELNPPKDLSSVPDYRLFATLEGTYWFTDDPKYNRSGYGIGFGLKYPLQKKSNRQYFFLKPRVGFCTTIDDDFVFAESLLDFQASGGFHFILGLSYMEQATSHSNDFRSYKDKIFVIYGIEAEIKMFFVQFRIDEPIQTLFRTDKNMDWWVRSSLVLGVTF